MLSSKRNTMRAQERARAQKRDHQISQTHKKTKTMMKAKSRKIKSNILELVPTISTQ